MTDIQVTGKTPVSESDQGFDAVPAGRATSVGMSWRPGFDRILEFEPRSRGVAFLNVTRTLPIFSTHFPRRPILPGVLIIESCVALATLVSGDPHSRLVEVVKARFRTFVTPGDQLVLSVKARSSEPGFTAWQVEATVEGKKVVTIQSLILSSHHSDPKGDSE